MYLLLGIAALLAQSYCVAAVPTAASHVLHEKRDSTHPRWEKRSPLHHSVGLPMRIGLTQSNLERGADYIMDVYVCLSTALVTGSTHPDPS